MEKACKPSGPRTLPWRSRTLSPERSEARMSFERSIDSLLSVAQQLGTRNPSSVARLSLPIVAQQIGPGYPSVAQQDSLPSEARPEKALYNDPPMIMESRSDSFFSNHTNTNHNKHKHPLP